MSKAHLKCTINVQNLQLQVPKISLRKKHVGFVNLDLLRQKWHLMKSWAKQRVKTEYFKFEDIFLNDDVQTESFSIMLRKFCRNFFETFF